MSSSNECPLLEFDTDQEAVFEPHTTQPAVDAPRTAVGCFNPAAIDDMVGADGKNLMLLPSREPLWEVEHDGQRLALFYPGQGPSLAATVLERVIAAGSRSVVFCGGAGALVPELALGQVIIVTSAVRDEGTSFHYQPPAREIQCDPSVLETLRESCSRADVRHREGKSWTTDAIFRETRTKVTRRREEGCITVENEASALFAVGAFRNVPIGVLLYAGDDLSGDAWDDRGWTTAIDAQRRLLALAADAALALATSGD